MSVEIMHHILENILKRKLRRGEEGPLVVIRIQCLIFPWVDTCDGTDVALIVALKNLILPFCILAAFCHDISESDDNGAPEILHVLCTNVYEKIQHERKSDTSKMA